jgi:hypothetical protein
VDLATFLWLLYSAKFKKFIDFDAAPGRKLYISGSATVYAKSGRKELAGYV